MTLSQGNKWTVWIVIAVITALVVIILALPSTQIMFHDFYFWLRFTVLTIPTTLWVVCTVGLILLLNWVLGDFGFWLGVILSILIGLWWFPYADAKTNVALVAEMDSSITATELNDVTTSKLRIYPVDVAKSRLKQENNRSQSGVGDIDVILSDSYHWIAPGIPKGARWLSSGNDAVYHLDTANPDQAITNIYEFKYGEGLPAYNNIHWQFHRKFRYWTKVPDVFIVKSDAADGYLGVGSYYGYEPVDFWGYKPVWEGAFVFTPDGTITDYSVEEVMRSLQFREQQSANSDLATDPPAKLLPFENIPQMVPEWISKRYATAWSAYKGTNPEGLNSIWSVFFNNIDQLEIPHISDSSNQMPYLLELGKRGHWVYTLEPDSDSAFQLRRILSQDAVSGQWKLISFPLDSRLIGPQKVLEMMRSKLQDKYTFQDTAEGSRRPTITEPQPVFYQGTLLYKASIIDGKGQTVISTVISNSTSEPKDFRLVEYSIGESDKLEDDLVTGRISLASSVSAQVISNQESGTPALNTQIDGHGVQLDNLTKDQLHQLLGDIADELQTR